MKRSHITKILAVAIFTLGFLLNVTTAPAQILPQTIPTTLGVGSSGTAVTTLQQFLMAQGYLDPSLPTGYYGQLTAAAVLAFQQAHQLAGGNGNVGPQTSTLINHMLLVDETGNGFVSVGSGVVNNSNVTNGANITNSGAVSNNANVTNNANITASGGATTNASLTNNGAMVNNGNVSNTSNIIATPYIPTYTMLYNYVQSNYTGPPTSSALTMTTNSITPPGITFTTNSGALVGNNPLNGSTTPAVVPKGFVMPSPGGYSITGTPVFAQGTVVATTATGPTPGSGNPGPTPGSGNPGPTPGSGSTPTVSTSGYVGKIQNPLTGITSLAGFVAAVLGILLKIGVPLVAAFIIYSGLMFVLARGNPEKLDKAKTQFFYTLVGAAILLGAWMIAEVIQETIKALTA